MDQQTQLKEAYDKFCSFGKGSSGPNQEKTMEGAKFAKLCRDTNILDKKITPTDIVFNKVKPKTERQINFKMFQEALTLLAAKKYPSATPDDAFRKIVDLVCKEGPTVKATAVKSDAVLERLTDTNAYTGAHKNRFDANGKGLGLAGRDSPSKTAELSTMVTRK